MPKLDDQIATLQERLTLLKLRQQRADARQRALNDRRERKVQTRRQMLVGAVILEKVRVGDMDANLLRQWLDVALTRPADRTLFQLESGPTLSTSDV